MKPEYILGATVLAFVVFGGTWLLFSGKEQSKRSAAAEGISYVEIANPAGFVNTDGITIGELVGKKVILVEFLTYSCINCQRTFPYVVSWYSKYKDEGLEIIGIHTPEFAFEKDSKNVREAMKKFGITYPIVLDNDYATWNAYGNKYWPRKYLVDIHGTIVYDHIGEGAYEETEERIRELLRERARVLNEPIGTDTERSVEVVEEKKNGAQSPETYFGSLRNSLLGNGTAGREGTQNFIVPTQQRENTLYLGGTWNVTPEYAKSVTNSHLVYTYRARYVYLVMRSTMPVPLEVWQDGVFVRTVTVQDSQLYTLIENSDTETHTLELRTTEGGLEVYAFTFG